MSADKISVVVPCYNEDEVLPLFIKTIINVFTKDLPCADLELILVDDGSSDNTLSILKDYSQNYKCIKYISFSRNFGKEGALFAGLANAGGTYIVIMDADLQHPPELIPKMYQEIKNSAYDMIGTYRSSRQGEGKIRSFFSRKFYHIMNGISEIDMMENAMDFRMFSNRAVKTILSLPEYNRFSKGIYSWIGYKTKYLSFDNIERAAGSTKWHFKGLLKYSLEGCIAFSTAPLTISSILGIGFCLIAFIMIIVLIIQSLIYGIEGSGFATIICTILMVGGVQLFCIGILGQYLSKAYLESKRRPKYIIAESNIEEKHT